MRERPRGNRLFVATPIALTPHRCVPWRAHLIRLARGRPPRGRPPAAGHPGRPPRAVPPAAAPCEGLRDGCVNVPWSGAANRPQTPLAGPWGGCPRRIAFVQLGRWQLGVAHDKARAEAVASAGSVAPVALSTLLAPHTSFPGDASGRLVTATGRYAAGQVLVAGRLLNGASGYWLVTPLTVQGGGTFPVVRGWTPTPVAPPPPAQAITVTASLALARPLRRSSPGRSAGRVDLARLVNTWPGTFQRLGSPKPRRSMRAGPRFHPVAGPRFHPVAGPRCRRGH